MEVMVEVLNKDLRNFAKSEEKFHKHNCCVDVLSVENYCEIVENCIDCRQKHHKMHRTHRHKIYKTKRLLSYFLIITSIYIMSTNKAEAVPVPLHHSNKSSEESPPQGKEKNFLNPQCENESKNTLQKALLNDAELRQRLEDILRSCRYSLFRTNHLTADYIHTIWGSTDSVETHHKIWKHKHIPWLLPDTKPLPHDFRGEIHEHHRKELLHTDWSREKIFEYLGKIYQRFQRIGVGIQIVNKWNELASMEGTTLMNTAQVNASKNIFKSASDDIMAVLCDIQSLFLDMAIDPRQDLDITPFVLDNFIKLNHWLVYREYENLMDYSHKLLKIITDDKNHGQ